MPDYPCTEDTGGVPWRKTSLYGLVGWFAQEFICDRAAVGFGGFFRLDKERGSFDGSTADIYGHAVINGRMSDTVLEWTKRYIGHQQQHLVDRPIHYRFELQNDLWVGRYAFGWSGRTIRDEARCQITVFHDDAFGIVIPVR